MTDKLPSYYDCLLKKYPEIRPDEWLLLNRIAVAKRIKKGEAFLRYGNIARYSAFVLSGLFKYCILDRHLPQSILRMIPQCGHVPMMERPVAFNSLLEDFLQAQQGPGVQGTI